MYSENNNFNIPQGPKPVDSWKIPWYRKWWGIFIIIFLTFILIFSIAFGIYIGRIVYLVRTAQITPAQILGNQSWVGQNGINLIAENSFRKGTAEAKVVIVEFGDYTCPACQQEYPVIKKLLNDYGDKILFVYRDFPAIQDRPLSVVAAVAANCAGSQGKFWEMQERLFLFTGELSEQVLKTYAIQLGLDSLEFGTCLVDQNNLKRIENDLQQGYEAGVRATPTFFINGRMVAGALPFSLFESAITSALSE